MKNDIKDLCMPIICLSIGIWAAFTYPTQIHGFVEKHMPVAIATLFDQPAAAAAEQPPTTQPPTAQPPMTEPPTTTTTKPAVKTPPATTPVIKSDGRFVHGPINCVAKPGADAFWAAYTKDAEGSDPYWDYVRQEACS